MPLAGYSGTPLIKKLGIKPCMKVLLINEPKEYYELLETNLNEQLCKKSEMPDFVHLFVKNNNEFFDEMKKLKSIIKKNLKSSFGFPGIRKQQKFLLILQKIR